MNEFCRPRNTGGRQVVRFLLCLSVLLAAFACPCIADEMNSGQGSLAQQTVSQQSIYVVVHVDLDSKQTNLGVRLLGEYSQKSRQDRGNLSIRLLQEKGRPNHLTLVEGWRDEAAYTSHVESLYAKQFRSEIQPLLGSPFDERLHHEVDTAH